MIDLELKVVAESVSYVKKNVKSSPKLSACFSYFLGEEAKSCK